MVECEVDEVSNGLWARFSESEGFEELVDGNGGDLESLGAPEVEEGFGGVEEGSGTDGDVVGLES